MPTDAQRLRAVFGAVACMLVLLAVVLSVGGPSALATDAGALPSVGAGAPAKSLDGGAGADSDADAPSKLCLANLRERGVDFMEWPTKGVRTPIRLVGSNLGPLRLVILDRKPGGVMPVMDCELGRALLDAYLVDRADARKPLFERQFKAARKCGCLRHG